MNTLQWVMLVLGATVLFWVIGAYNRLVAMRNAIADSWLRVQEAVDQRGTTVEPLAAALAQEMVAEQGALDTWLAAHVDALRAAGAMAARPVHEGHAQAWVAAESALGAATSRVLALLEQHPALSEQEAVVALAQAWREGQSRLPFARQQFNEAAAGYNAAAALFPTQLVARGFGLGRAGLI